MSSKSWKDVKQKQLNLHVSLKVKLFENYVQCGINKNKINTSNWNCLENVESRMSCTDDYTRKLFMPMKLFDVMLTLYKRKYPYYIVLHGFALSIQMMYSRKTDNNYNTLGGFILQ